MTIFLIVEKDRNGDTLWTWTYPSIDEGLRELLLRKCCLAEKEDSELVPFSFGHFGRMWYYVLTVAAGESEHLPQVSGEIRLNSLIILSV